MNLFHVIANHTSPREATPEPLSTGLFAARAEAGAPPKQDFSKLFSQSMKLRHPVRQADVQRQDLADQQTRPRNDSASAAPESGSRSPAMTRDARFVPDRRAANTQEYVRDASGTRNSEPEQASARSSTETLEGAESAGSPQPPLTTLTLGSGIQIITTDRPAITDESLTIYARNMGLDESTIQKLLNPPASTPLQGANNGVGSTPLPSVVGLSLPSVPLNTERVSAGSPSPASASAALSPLASETQASLVPQEAAGLKNAPLLATPTSDALPVASGSQAIMANLPAVPPPLAAAPENVFSAAWPAAEGHLREAALASTWPVKSDSLASTAQPQLSSIASMGAIEPKLLATADINTAVAAGPALGNGLAANATVISTAAILSMLSNDLSAKQIDGLSELYDEPVAVDAEDVSTGALPALDTARAGTSTKLPSAAPSAAHLPANMAEVYEKLSAKLNTELAARMHQQISDGQWKMKFALKPASLGAVDIQLEMRDGKLAALLQAENPLTQDLLRHGSDKLKQTLSDLGLAQASVHIGQGQSQGQAQGHRSSPSETAQFRDNPTQVDTQNSEDTAKPLPRRNSLSQFDLYA